MKKQKVLIDTDIGDEIDDALALYFAMQKNIEIVGVTTVFKNTVQRAQMAKKILSLFSCGYENVPVYAGYSSFDSENIDNANINHYTADLDEYFIENSNPQKAVDFIIESCKKYGSALTIVAIGPFTNIAKAIQKEPSVFDKVKVVIMGGAYYSQYADWNVSCDTKSAKIVFDKVKNLECLGADVTHKLKISLINRKKIVDYKDKGNNAVGRYLGFIYDKFNAKDYEVFLHDPLAVYYAIDSSVCTMENARVEVIEDGAGKGITLNLEEYNKEYLNSYYKNRERKNAIKVAKQVKKKEFINLFMKIFEM